MIFTHLVPQRTPIALVSFMVIIELVSCAIRPLTLAVRLVANIVAGHLLLSLLGAIMSNLIWYRAIFLLVPFLLLASLEIGVSMIQSYVFTLLSTLYLREESPNELQ